MTYYGLWLYKDSIVALKSSHSQQKCIRNSIASNKKKYKVARWKQINYLNSSQVILNGNHLKIIFGVNLVCINSGSVETSQLASGAVKFLQVQLCSTFKQTAASCFTPSGRLCILPNEWW